MSEWADKHRVLDPMFSAEPGKWRTSRVPYAREWMDSAGKRHVRRIALMASTQLGKTEAMNNIGGFYIHQDPSPIMFVMPSRETAKLAAERRIMPMVRASPVLTAELSERAHDTRNREVAFRRSLFYFRSAQSPTDLSSVPVRVVLADELDKWPRWSGREASPLALVNERTRTYYDHVVIVASTPTTRAGLILQEFEAGDQRRYWMPCLHCGEWIKFEWKQVRWLASITNDEEMRERREAWYECQSCSGKIDDKAKRLMVAKGVWVPAKFSVHEWLDGGSEKDTAPQRSYHIWAAYSPWVTWWKLAAEFLKSKDDPALMMNFTNSWLAEVWEERVEATSEASVIACIDAERAQWDVPDEVLVVTASVDVQKDALHFALQGWGMDEENWLLAVDRVPDWDALADVLFRNAFGTKQLGVRICLIDSRYRREEVMEFCRRWPAARMIAGVDRELPIPFSVKKIDRHPRTGQPLPASMPLWSITVAYFKDLLAHRLTSTAAGTAQSGRLHLPNDLSPNRLRELHAEHKILERVGNKTRAMWVLKPGHHRNELWDLLTYNAAAGRMIRVDALRSAARMPQKPTTTSKPPTSRRPGVPRIRPQFPRLGQE